jgi:hypothetical protein
MRVGEWAYLKCPKDQQLQNERIRQKHPRNGSKPARINWGWKTKSSARLVFAVPIRGFLWPLRRYAPSPYRLGYSEIPIVLDVALADDFPSAVNEIELAELFVLVLQVDCPIPASGGSGIGTPG